MTLLAIVAIHTAANEPPKVRQVMNKIHRNVGLAPGRALGLYLGMTGALPIYSEHG